MFLDKTEKPTSRSSTHHRPANPQTRANTDEINATFKRTLEVLLLFRHPGKKLGPLLSMSIVWLLSMKGSMNIYIKASLPLQPRERIVYLSIYFVCVCSQAIAFFILSTRIISNPLLVIKAFYSIFKKLKQLTFFNAGRKLINNVVLA